MGKGGREMKGVREERRKREWKDGGWERKGSKERTERKKRKKREEGPEKGRQEGRGGGKGFWKGKKAR